MIKAGKWLQQNLKDVDYFSVIDDMWSSHSLQPYLSYIIHFVGNKWGLKTRFLQTLHLLQEYTGKNSTDTLLETLES